MKRELNRMNAAPNAAAQSVGGSRRKHRNKRKTRRHKK